MLQRQARSTSLLALCPTLLIAGVYILGSGPGTPGSQSQGAAGPTCDAGPSQVIECTGPVMQIQLDGSGSVATSGGPLRHLWTLCGDPAFMLSSPNGAAPILTVDMNGSCLRVCSIRLRVWNHSGASTCRTTITVQDTTPPAITCPPDAIVKVGDLTDPGTLGVATATDACNPAPIVTWSDDLSGITSAGSGTILRTWTADDGCQTSSCVQTIQVARKVHFQLFPNRCPNDLIVSSNPAAQSLAGDRIESSILGNAIDVTQVDLSSLQLTLAGNFDGPSVLPVNIAFADLGTPIGNLEYCRCDLTGPDGKMDIYIEFDTQEVIDAFGLASLPSGTLFPVNIVGDLTTQELFCGLDCFLIQVP